MTTNTTAPATATTTPAKADWKKLAVNAGKILGAGAGLALAGYAGYKVGHKAGYKAAKADAPSHATLTVMAGSPD